MQAWEHKISSPEGGTRLTTRNAQYDSFLEAFIFKEKGATAWGDSLNFFRITSILNNYLVKYQVKETVRQWANTHINYCDFSLNNRPSLVPM